MSSPLPYVPYNTKYEGLKPDVQPILDAYFENGQGWQDLVGDNTKLAQAIEVMGKSVKERGKVDKEKGDSKHIYWTAREAEVLNALNQEAAAKKQQKQLQLQQQQACKQKQFYAQKNVIKTDEAYPDLLTAVQKPKGTVTQGPKVFSYANAATNKYQ
jgi:hypothetical protein